ncbi:MAG: hypothetical protein HUJ70_06515 [Pseudobutyrivibrio sp.]|nr:hypothetical protein [Pseudobutyrivibrio sp.]
MIQEKYNQLIYDTATEECLMSHSHLRANILAPLNFKAGQKVAFLNPEVTALREYLQEVTGTVSDTVSEDCDFIIMLEKLLIAPSEAKTKLKDGGAFVFAASVTELKPAVLDRICRDSGFKEVEIFYAKPDHLFTTEIASAEYLDSAKPKKEAFNSYLLIAR